MNIISAKELRILTKRSAMISYFNKVVSDAASAGATACAVEFEEMGNEEYEFLLNTLGKNGYLFELYYKSSGAGYPTGVVVCWNNNPSSLNKIFSDDDEICRE